MSAAAKKENHSDPKNIVNIEAHPAAHSHKRHKKHKAEHHEEVHEGEGPWIVSYADMMTLLFCFFVIMTSFANFDPVVVAKKSAVVSEHFSKGEKKGEELDIKSLGNEIGAHPNLKGLAKSEVKDGTLEIVFTSSIMFPSGEVEISKDFQKNIDILVGLIKNKNPDYRVIVEGHTDLSPMQNNHKFGSKWELSSARAARVIERFIFYEFKPNQLVSVGFGDSRPVAPEFDKSGQVIPENSALNSRVVIKVLKPLKSSKKKNLGIETYFDNNEIMKQ